MSWGDLMTKGNKGMMMHIEEIFLKDGIVCTGVNGNGLVNLIISNNINNSGGGIITIDNNNDYIGINNSTPAYQLDVFGAINSSSNISATGNLNIIGIASLASVNISGNLDVSGNITYTGTLSVLGQSNLNNFVVIDNSMSVATNNGALQILGSNTGVSGQYCIMQFRNPLYTTSGIWQIFLQNCASSASGDIDFYEEGIASRLHLKKGGFIGINNNNPFYALDIVGSFNISENIIIGNNLNIYSIKNKI